MSGPAASRSLTSLKPCRVEELAAVLNVAIRTVLIFGSAAGAAERVGDALADGHRPSASAPTRTRAPIRADFGRRGFHTGEFLLLGVSLPKMRQDACQDASFT